MCPVSIYNAALFIVIISVTLVTALDTSPLQDHIIASSTLSNTSESELKLISSALNYTKASDTPPLLNLSIPDVGLHSNDVQVRRSYGRELECNDCLDALNTVAYPQSRNLTVGPRKGGYPYWDLDLPLRWISGNLHQSGEFHFRHI